MHSFLLLRPSIDNIVFDDFIEADAWARGFFHAAEMDILLQEEGLNTAASTWDYLDFIFEDVAVGRDKRLLHLVYEELGQLDTELIRSTFIQVGKCPDKAYRALIHPKLYAKFKELSFI